uniref:Uncharacterized protein n=1 Tax=Triticum urartu TaxID=4572 RepID=A0A8R7Q2S1_TRIUA
AGPCPHHGHLCLLRRRPLRSLARSPSTASRTEERASPDVVPLPFSVHQEPKDKGVLQAFPSPFQEKALGKTDYRARLRPTRTRTSTIPPSTVLLCELPTRMSLPKLFTLQLLVMS